MYNLIDLIEQYGCFVSRLDLAVCIGASAGEKKASCPTSLPIVEVALAMGYCSPKSCEQINPTYTTAQNFGLLFPMPQLKKRCYNSAISAFSEILHYCDVLLPIMVGDPFRDRPFQSRLS